MSALDDRLDAIRRAHPCKRDGSVASPRFYAGEAGAASTCCDQCRPMIAALFEELGVGS